MSGSGNGRENLFCLNLRFLHRVEKYRIWRFRNDLGGCLAPRAARRADTWQRLPSAWQRSTQLRSRHGAFPGTEVRIHPGRSGPAVARHHPGPGGGRCRPPWALIKSHQPDCMQACAHLGVRSVKLKVLCHCGKYSTYPLATTAFNSCKILLAS